MRKEKKTESKRKIKLFAAVRCSMLPNQILGYSEITLPETFEDWRNNEHFDSFLARILPICCDEYESPCGEFLLFYDGIWVLYHIRYGRGQVEHSSRNIPEKIRFIK